MNMRGIVRIVGLAALSYAGMLGTAHADIMWTSLDQTNVAAFGSGPYGSVLLTESAGGVEFSVALRSDLAFVTTGNQNSHAVFSFNATDVSLGDIGPITDVDGNGYLALTPGANSPFGSFTWGIFCDTGCEKGGSGDGYNPPLTFFIANATLADFGWGTYGGFAADVICISGSCDGATGAIGVPEPGTLALLGLGLAGLGLGSRRRRKI